MEGGPLIFSLLSPPWESLLKTVQDSPCIGRQDGQLRAQGKCILELCHMFAKSICSINFLYILIIVFEKCSLLFSARSLPFCDFGIEVWLSPIAEPYIPFFLYMWCLHGRQNQATSAWFSVTIVSGWFLYQLFVGGFKGCHKSLQPESRNQDRHGTVWFKKRDGILALNPAMLKSTRRSRSKQQEIWVVKVWSDLKKN